MPGSDVEAVVWDEAGFTLNESTFGALTKMAERFDFAVCVFDADDVEQIRRTEVRTVRDDVVFELGLFIRLGTRASVLDQRGRNLSPAFGHEPPMPSQKRRRGDKKRRPPDSRQHLGRGRKKPSIG
jgi:hypothetical protein